MKALVFHGKMDVRVETVPDPQLLNPKDAIVQVTRTAICGSDLHLYHGLMPALEPGDILGHEFTGVVLEVGSKVRHLKKGDRVVVPFTISCGNCFHCKKHEYSLCDNSNTNPTLQEAAYGASTAGLYGYTHMLGGYAGGQAEFVRVPFAEVGCLKIPDQVSDERALFLSDIFPTGFQAVENAGVGEGDTVAVWGCGPVGLFAIKSAQMFGPEKVIAIDGVDERLELARKIGAVVVDYRTENPLTRIPELTGGRGADCCIDAVGMESHGFGPGAIYDKAKHLLRLQTDRPNVLRQAIQTCRKGGTVSIPGVYGGLIDKLNLGSAFGKGLTFKMGQTHVQKYMKPLLEKIVNGEIDPTFLITHRDSLLDAAEAYRRFSDKEDGCIKVVLDPLMASRRVLEAVEATALPVAP
ncbi:MAG: zinc-dependent alcohol dehydrogenase [Vulcanimicrobiota bacterium]